MRKYNGDLQNRSKNMNDLFVILVQDKKVPSEGTLFWGAKNEDYLWDAFAEAGFDVLYPSDREEKWSNRNLLFVFKQAFIKDPESLWKTVKESDGYREPGFSLNGLIYYVKKNNPNVFSWKDDAWEFSSELTRRNDSTVLDIGTVEGFHEAISCYRRRIVERHMKKGVVFIDPDRTYIDYGVEIGEKTVIYPGCMIEGDTVIREGSVIGPDTIIKNSRIGKNNTIIKSIITDSECGNDCNIGPFAYIRPGCMLHDRVKVGDFVELKNSEIGETTKIPHLAYIGDASVGMNTNIACGVITANYDGKTKHRTVIGNHAFIGCNVALVAPVTVRDGAYIAAGSTITQEVPAHALAIARERQTNKEDWVIKKGLRRDLKND
jgi:NDP-sugar pyrophosphorylase family protein